MAKTPTPVKTPEPPKADEKPAVAQGHAEVPETKAPVAQANEAQGTIPARILVDQGRHRCNTLALLTEEEAANCKGWADLSDEAVAYVKSLED